MTVQEAIKQLKAIRSDYDDDMQRFPELVMQDVEALDMAIKALTHFNSTSNSIKNELNELSCSKKPNRSEPLTDKEQRIFLAAIEREREVCKQVDKEWRDCREPYEDSLVSVCNEIERKVKGALWET